MAETNSKTSLAFVQVSLYRCEECHHWELIAKLNNTNVKGGMNQTLLLDTNTQPRQATAHAVPPPSGPPPLPPSFGGQGSPHIQE